MATLKELQLSNPIGTRFCKQRWIAGMSIYFDGELWRHDEDDNPIDDIWPKYWRNGNDWRVFTPPRKWTMESPIVIRSKIAGEDRFTIEIPAWTLECNAFRVTIEETR